MLIQMWKDMPFFRFKPTSLCASNHFFYSYFSWDQIEMICWIRKQYNESKFFFRCFLIKWMKNNKINIYFWDWLGQRMIHCIIARAAASHSVFSFIFMSKVDISICIPSGQLGNKQSGENSNKMFQWNTCDVRKSIEWVYRFFLFLYKKYWAIVLQSISNWMNKWMNDSFSFCFCYQRRIFEYRWWKNNYFPWILLSIPFIRNGNDWIKFDYKFHPISMPFYWKYSLSVGMISFSMDRNFVYW